MTDYKFTPIDHIYRLKEYCDKNGLSELGARHIVSKININASYALGWTKRDYSHLVNTYKVPALEQNETNFCVDAEAKRDSLTKRLFFNRAVIMNPKPAFEQILTMLGVFKEDLVYLYEPDMSNKLG